MFEHSYGMRVMVTSLVLLLTGCASQSIKKVESPEQLKILASSYTPDQKTLDEAQYTSQVLAGNLSGARATRDIIVQSTRKEIEIVYQDFEQGLYANKAAFDVQTDIFELILSTATTVTGAERARTNLSALLTGTKGSRLSVDKNVFGEKTYAALVSQMRASRSKVGADIFEKLARLDVLGYPLAEAEVDLVHLFNAGTIHEALIQLSTQAGANAEIQAQKEAAMARIKLNPATQAEVDQIQAIRSRFNTLFANKDVATARKILKILDPTAPDSMANDDVWKGLDTQIRKASDQTYLPTLTKAFATP